MRYSPDASETAERTFSMSAGLAASTVTPGSTPPDASRTVPVRDAWAKTLAGSRTTTASIKHFKAVFIREASSFQVVGTRVTAARHGRVVPNTPAGLCAKKNTGRENPCQILVRLIFALRGMTRAQDRYGKSCAVD